MVIKQKAANEDGAQRIHVDEEGEEYTVQPKGSKFSKEASCKKILGQIDECEGRVKWKDRRVEGAK
jgi:hypothetical protein